MIPFEFGDEPYDSSSSTMVSCGVTKGDTPISIVWLFNGNPISTNDGVLITKSGQKISTLSIESVQSRHAGNYTCVARNRAGQVSHSSELKVIGKIELSILHFCFILFPPYPSGPDHTAFRVWGWTIRHLQHYNGSLHCNQGGCSNRVDLVVQRSSTTHGWRSADHPH